MHRPPTPSPGDALPPPDAAAAAQSARLSDRIREAIEQQGGAIPFSRYMELALYAPRLGYYTGELAKFGPWGDFVTAPELSALFSHCVARQVGDTLAALGGGDVLEVGAGSGIMAAHVLKDLASCRGLPHRYLILERSPALRRLQRSTLQSEASTLLDRIVWLETLPPPGFRGIVIANEVLDALPSCRFQLSESGLLELAVAWKNGRFEWQPSRKLQPGLANAVRVVQKTLEVPLPTGYTSEISLALKPWVCALAERVQTGLILLFDYGYPRREYYHPQRVEGTLLCYYQHRVHSDPLILTGLQDISVCVDFTAVAEAASACGLDVAGLTTQAAFLLATGITEMATNTRPGTPEHVQVSTEIKRLMLPGEMGELVKVMALTRGFEYPLVGFSGVDLRSRL